MKPIQTQSYRHRPFFWMVIVSFCFVSLSAHAQYRNNAVQVPSIGYMAMGAMDYPTQLVVEGLGIGDKNDWKWNATDNLTLGAGYSRALGYNLWYEVQASVGFGLATFPPTGSRFHPLVSLSTSTGLRYNFLDEEYRPFVAGHIQYLWLYNTLGPGGEDLDIQTNELLGDQSMWVGARGGVGFEWFFVASLRGWGADVPLFYDEMSVQAEADALCFLSLSEFPINPSGIFRISYNVYF